MRYDHDWFCQNFSTALKNFKTLEKEFPNTQFGYAKSVEFELPEKVLGYVTIYESGVLEIVVANGKFEELMNVFIVEQNVNSDNEKEKAFEDLMNIMSQIINDGNVLN